MSTTVWLIPACPLLGALVTMVFGGALGRRAHWVGVLAVAAAFVSAGAVFARVLDGQAYAVVRQLLDLSVHRQFILPEWSSVAGS